MYEDKKLEERNQNFIKKKTQNLINERTSYSLKLRKEKLNDRFMKNRFKIIDKEVNSDSHLIININELELKEEFKMSFENCEEKIEVLLTILRKSSDLNNIKFAINYLRCLSEDNTTLKFLKEYINIIVELIYKFLAVDDQKYEVTWILVNITEFTDINLFLFNRTNLETLVKLLEFSKDNHIKQNVLSIFYNILDDNQNYDYLTILVPSFPSIIKSLLIEDKQDNNIKFKVELIKNIYQISKFSVELVHSKFSDEQSIKSIMRFIQIGSYCCNDLLYETLLFVNLQIKSENEFILNLFLDRDLVNILLSLFDQNLDLSEDTIFNNIEITKIMCNLLLGKASNCERVLSYGIIPFYEKYLNNFISSSSTFNDENYISLLGDIIFLSCNIAAGSQNQCEELILHSNILTLLLDNYKRIKQDQVIYDLVYILYCSIIIGSKEVVNKILFTHNTFEMIYYSLNLNKEVINCTLNFLLNSVNRMKSSRTQFERLIEQLKIYNIEEKLEGLQYDKNEEISAKALNILELIWEYNDKVV